MCINNHLKQYSSNGKHDKLVLRPLAMAIAITFATVTPNISNAQTYTVENVNNVGLKSLRQAVFLANGNAGPDIINFNIPSNLGSTINLSSELLISSSMTITGPTAGDPNSVVINAGGASRVINASALGSADNLTLENITLTGGHTEYSASHDGGGMLIGDGNVVLNHILITNNRANYLDIALNHGFTHGGGIRMNIMVISPLIIPLLQIILQIQLEAGYYFLATTLLSIIQLSQKTAPKVARCIVLQVVSK